MSTSHTHVHKQCQLLQGQRQLLQGQRQLLQGQHTHTARLRSTQRATHTLIYMHTYMHVFR